MSEILDRVPHVLELVVSDIVRGKRPDRGRNGMTAEQVLRVLIIKQMHGFSYHDLAFHVAANTCYRSFCRIGDFDSVPKRSTLQSNVKKLSPDTVENINLAILTLATDDGVEYGRKVRIDCTSVETNIHDPTDSNLLWDVIRVLSRVTRRAHEDLGASTVPDHSRRGKRRMVAILNAGTTKKRLPLYADLIKVANKTMANAKLVAEQLKGMEFSDISKALLADALVVEIGETVKLGQKVEDQARRRVIEGESVPVEEKIVSIFEPHTDILVKGKRKIEYGHKICLTTGPSCLILDCQILDGNPADSTLATEMIERHIAHYDTAPRQAAFDGGFASKDNVAQIKNLGVGDVAFSKRCGIEILDMVKSSWVYRRLRNFRAGVEGTISFFKRCFGGTRCSWSGLRSFKTYVWGSIISCNLLVLARHQLATQ